MKDALLGKTVEFLDANGIRHYGKVKRTCRISLGSKKDRNKEKRVRKSTKGFVVFQEFKSLGRGQGKEYRVQEHQIIMVRVRQKSVPIKEWKNSIK